MSMLSDAVRKSVRLVPWRYRERIKNLPLIGAAQRLVVDRLGSSGKFLHTVDAGPARGLRIWIELPQDKQIWTGTYESAFANTLAAAVRAGDACLDIGGYRGFFSGVCALAGARAVHIFEPLPANAVRIESLIEANPTLPLTLHRVAMGAEVGATEFVVMPEESMGKLSTSSFQQQAHGENIPVQIETLDHLIGSGAVPAPDVIKIDVEGAEGMVLAGGEQTLRSARARLFMEIHSRALARECADVLARFGYSIHVLETGKAPDFVSEPEVCHFAAAKPA